MRLDGHNLGAYCTEQLTSAKHLLEQIKALKAAPDATSLLAFYNQMSCHLDSASALCGLMSQVHPEEKVRNEADDCELKVHEFMTELSLDRELYELFLRLPDAGLDPEEKRLKEKTLRNFRRSGVDKDDGVREKIKQVEEELVRIGQDFGRHIREDVRHIEVSAGALEGLPKDYIDARVKGQGPVRITTDYPDYIPFMTYSKDNEARRSLWMQYQNRAYPKNVAVLNTLLQKRYELSQLLGYASYADFVVETKMVKNTQTVAEFIERVSEVAHRGASEEYELLVATKRETTPDATCVLGYERAFLEECYKKRHYNYDSQEVRPYFQFEKVLDGLLAVTSELFGITYRALTQVALWHESVKAYEVWSDNQLLGKIYLDLHPRENKYKHAAQFTVTSGLAKGRVAEGALVCNFADPKLSSPALMDHDQVVTFFHEFGHLLHHIFGGNQRFIDFSGVATEWDFVEAPSQLFEEWAWDHGVLSRFAHHYETGATIPKDLVDRMRKADEFGKGLDARQQMFYAALSLNYYLRDPKTFDADGLLVELQNKYSFFKHVEGAHFNLSFGHLDGYSAMYYTYMWSKVIAKDLLSVFLKNGMMSLPDANRYKQKVLAVGGREDATDLIQAFLGRPYQFDAFQKWIESR